MVTVGLVGLLGLALTVVWGGRPYVPWGDDRPATLQLALVRYARGALVGLVGGAWAGALVTGPAVRLIMRLLAVTGGDGAQGRVTEADEVIGDIDLGGTIGLIVFGGVLTGVGSGLLYVVVRRWLPAGRPGGAVFGLLHLVVAATRADPLRPGNPDFDLVGPSWLAVLTFGVAAVLHGLAVRAFVDRCSAAWAPRGVPGSTGWIGRLLPVPPTLVMLPFLAPVVVLGALPAVLVLRSDGLRAAAARPVWLRAGRLALLTSALVLLPWTLLDVVEVLHRS